MKKIFTLLLVLNIAFLVNAQVEIYSKVQINTDAAGLKVLAKQGIPVEEGFYDAKESIYTIDLSQSEIANINAMGIVTKTLIQDVSAYYAQRNASVDLEEIMSKARLNPQDYQVPEHFELGSCGGFSTLDQCYAHLDQMATLYPDLITVRTAVDNSTTYQGRTMYYVKISDNPNVNENEPEVLYTGMHHAREPIGMQHLLFYMYYLLENYETDHELRDLVNNTEMYFIPVINVDGYSYNIQTNPGGGGMWRKNRFDNGDGSYGIDINRNYGYMWGYDDEGSSPFTWDETYRGTEPFSEEETQMIREFCEDHEFQVALNYHSHSNLLLYAWGWTPEACTDDAVFAEYSKYMTQDNHYTYGPGSTTIYPTNGGSDDWMYGEQTTKEEIMAYTPEVGNQNDNFWPPASRIIPLCQENMLQSIYAAKFAGTIANLIDQTPIIIPEKEYYAIFDVTRLGQTDANYTVKIEPLGDEFESIGDSITISGLAILGKATDSIPFTLKNTVKSGDTLRFVLVMNDGFYIYRDTVEKYFGTPVELFNDDLTTLDNWTGQWGQSGLFPHSAPYSMADSPTGNYGNYNNKSTQLTVPITLTNASVAVLNFYARWKLEPSYDYVQVFISNNNGSSWTPLEGRYTKPGSINQAFEQPVYDGFYQWVKEEINISQFADENILLKFTLRSDQGTVFDGFYFDDITINIIDRTVNTQEINTPSVFLSTYPNPADERINFTYNLPEAINSAELIITDLSGRVLRSISVDNQSNQVWVSLSDLSAGVYICTLKSETKTLATSKITVK